MRNITRTRTLDEVRVDEQIERLEKEISVRSIAEQLWGGQRGPGLIYAVAELNKAAVSLAESVTRISLDIHGDGGMRVTMRDMQRDISELKTNQTEQRKIAMRAFWFLVVLGLSSLFANSHLLFDVVKETARP